MLHKIILNLLNNPAFSNPVDLCSIPVFRISRKHSNADAKLPPFTQQQYDYLNQIIQQQFLNFPAFTGDSPIFNEAFSGGLREKHSAVVEFESI